jgi:peroxiredoxin
MGGRLAPGQEAPDFVRKAHDGRTVSLAERRGRWVMLSFFRTASCPLCNVRLYEMKQRIAELEPVDVIGFIDSGEERIAGLGRRLDPPFPLLCDPERSLYREYGVEKSLSGLLHPSNLPAFIDAFRRGYWPSLAVDGPETRMPADFLIGPDGRLVEAHYGKRARSHIPFRRALAFAERAREEALS